MAAGLPVKIGVALLIALSGSPAFQPTAPVQRAVVEDRGIGLPEPLASLEAPASLGVGARLNDEIDAALARSRAA